MAEQWPQRISDELLGEVLDGVGEVYGPRVTRFIDLCITLAILEGAPIGGSAELAATIKNALGESVRELIGRNKHAGA